MSSGSLDFFAGVLRPGGGLVVERAGFEAAVQDADELVGELAQRGPVTGPAGPQLVVVGTGAGRGIEGGEGLAVEASRSRSLCTYRAMTVLRSRTGG
jgi:hypothetical protein